MSEEYDSELQECRGVLVELWTAVGKPLEADRRLLGGDTAWSAGTGVFGGPCLRNSRPAGVLRKWRLDAASASGSG